MPAVVCRFCLQNKSCKTNPFIAPCGCTGSGRFVHKDCLESWRLITPYAEHKIRCQLCLQNYVLPRKWPLEIIPTNDILWDSFLSHYILIAGIVHYIHLLCVMYIIPVPTTLQTSQSYIVYSNIQLLLYYFILSFISVLYGIYYYGLMINVLNRELYLQYSFRPNIVVFIALFMCSCMVQFASFPFGALYIYFLTYLRKVHMNTLILLNINGTT